MSDQGTCPLFFLGIPIKFQRLFPCHPALHVAPLIYPEAWLTTFSSMYVGETVSSSGYIKYQPLCEHVSSESEQNQLTRLSSTSTLSIALVGDARLPDICDNLFGALPCITYYFIFHNQTSSITGRSAHRIRGFLNPEGTFTQSVQVKCKIRY